MEKKLINKNLITACMAIAAFVVAPTASAAILTEGGVAVPVGASVTGSATEIKFTAGTSTETCSHMHMTGILTANANGTIAAEVPAGNVVVGGTGTSTDCTSTNLGPTKFTVNTKLCLHVAKGTDTGTITGCAGIPVTLSLEITNLGLTCRYEAASINARITTESEGKDAEVNVFEQSAVGEVANNFFCPAEGKLDMEFRLTTTAGTTLTVS